MVHTWCFHGRSLLEEKGRTCIQRPRWRSSNRCFYERSHRTKTECSTFNERSVTMHIWQSAVRYCLLAVLVCLWYLNQRPIWCCVLSTRHFPERSPMARIRVSRHGTFSIRISVFTVMYSSSGTYKSACLCVTCGISYHHSVLRWRTRYPASVKSESVNPRRTGYPPTLTRTQCITLLFTAYSQCKTEEKIVEYTYVFKLLSTLPPLQKMDDVFIEKEINSFYVT